MYDKYSHAVDRHLELEQEGKQPKPISPLLYLIHAFNDSITSHQVYGDREYEQEQEIDMFAKTMKNNAPTALELLQRGYEEA